MKLKKIVGQLKMFVLVQEIISQAEAYGINVRYTCEERMEFDRCNHPKIFENIDGLIVLNLGSISSAVSRGDKDNVITHIAFNIYKSIRDNSNEELKYLITGDVKYV